MNPGSGSYDYLNRALFISADQMRDYQTVGQHALLAAGYPAYVSSDVSDVVEAPTGDAANPATPLAPNAIQTMSEGWGMMTLLIHGVSDGWVLRSNQYNEWPKSFLFTASGADGEHGFLPNIESNGKPGMIYSIGCNNAAFDMDAPPFGSTNPCVAESFLAKPNGGAVGFVGYSRWGWVASSWKLEQAFIDTSTTRTTTPRKRFAIPRRCPLLSRSVLRAELLWRSGDQRLDEHSAGPSIYEQQNQADRGNRRHG